MGTQPFMPWENSNSYLIALYKRRTPSLNGSVRYEKSLFIVVLALKMIKVGGGGGGNW